MIGSRRLILLMVGVLLLTLGGSWIAGVRAQNRKEKTKTETYTRPKPREPIKPTVPDANRYQEDKVFLENADSLYRPANEFEEFQIVKGKVKFRQGGMWMFCDSAYYYPQKNSMDAFGHVEMRQGDTLFVYADKLYYNGFEKHATLVRGPSRNKVELRNRKVTLTTDSLDYDVNSEVGWYSTGGTLKDDVNTLTSIYGEYSPSTKLAKFRDNVVLVNNRDGYKMFTEELDYNTNTHIANINTRTRIEGANDTIVTTQGWYDTTNDHAQLTSRSTITHRDSNMNVTWLEGDSIIYDKATKTSRAYMFRDKFKTQQPMVITDTARKVQLIGGYGEYNDSTRRAMATEYPLLIDFSRPDTLFLRADTVLSLYRTEMVWPDSLGGHLNAKARERLRGFKTAAELAASLKPVLYTLPFGFKLPGWGLQTDTPRNPEMAAVTDTADIVKPDEIAPDSVPAESKAEVDPLQLITDEPKQETGVPDSVPTEPKQATSVANESRRRIDALGRDSAYMVPKDFRVAKALGKARVFSQDFQGVADTMIYQEYDSMLYMIRKPVVWSGERQVMGNRINVHVNDSTADWALLPETGMLSEHIDEDFYNQLSGSIMKAWLENQKIKRMEVEGNVQTIFMPQEDDSTFSKFVNAESSFLTIQFDDGKMQHLKMWPEVTGTVTPVGDVKRNQMYLQGFRWLDAIRPKRQWYGDRVRWIDELGELPEALEAWFLEPEPVKTEAPKPSDYKSMMRK